MRGDSMSHLSNLSLLWHTVRHLKPVQVYGRAMHRLKHPVPNTSAPPALRMGVGTWVPPAAREPSMVGRTRLRLLAVERDLASSGWDDPNVPLLWRYNLHYFDDLCASGCADRSEWHAALLRRWVQENAPGVGTGWDPYPTSLRIVNWIKWAWAGNELPPEFVPSLAVQARWLVDRMEWHLLGNHLFVNAKALVFAGLFFEGPEAERWLAVGGRVLLREIPEQVLADGGHFERSPMYHALALEDMLDLLNSIRRAAEPSPIRELQSMVSSRIQRMRSFLEIMCHPDGEIAFFNDAAMGVHPSPSELDGYARRLGLPDCLRSHDPILLLAETGYVRATSGDAVAIMDVGPIGPDYLPGHAHADSLSFELSIRGNRVLVNSGTSEYGIGAERLRQRGTAAHNTLVIEGQDSSEVWSGFRVARRARPFGLSCRSVGGTAIVECSHVVYRRLRRGLDHGRRWTLGPHSLEVDDRTTSPARLDAMLHWFPDFAVSQLGPCEHAAKGHGMSLVLRAPGTELAACPFSWHPRFGLSVPSTVSVASVRGQHLTTLMEWD